MRNEGPRAVLVITAAILLVDSYFKGPEIQSLAQFVRSWAALIAAFALGLGAISLLSNHYRKLATKSPTWLESAILLVSFAVVVIVGVAKSVNAPTYRFIFDYIMSPGGSTIFSLLAFYLTSAAYRAFRVRRLESSIVLVSGVLVMLGRVPIGKAMWVKLPDIAQWIIDVPNVAGMRGIVICAALGAIATAIRVLLGLERGLVGM